MSRLVLKMSKSVDRYVGGPNGKLAGRPLQLIESLPFPTGAVAPCLSALGRGGRTKLT